MTAAGRYYRDELGAWRREATGEPVPGAEDMTISNLYNFRVATFGDGAYVEVPVDLARREPELRFALEFLKEGRRDLQGREVIYVPERVWDTRSRQAIGMWAPELVSTRRERA